MKQEELQGIPQLLSSAAAVRGEGIRLSAAKCALHLWTAVTWQWSSLLQQQHSFVGLFKVTALILRNLSENSVSSARVHPTLGGVDKHPNLLSSKGLDRPFPLDCYLKTKGLKNLSDFGKKHTYINNLVSVTWMCRTIKQHFVTLLDDVWLGLVGGRKGKRINSVCTVISPLMCI